MHICKLIIDNYASSEVDEKKNLRDIDTFIHNISKPFDENFIEDRNVTLAKNALKHFDDFDKRIQEVIFTIIRFLTQQNASLCYDGLTRKYYNDIINTYARFQYLDTAIITLSIFLTPARLKYPLSSEQLERAKDMVAFACKYFQRLEEKTQSALYQMAHLSKIPLSDLLKEPYVEHYQFLLQHLQQIPLQQLTPHSIPNNVIEYNKKKVSFFKQLKIRFLNHRHPLTMEDFETDCELVDNCFSEQQLDEMEKKSFREQEERKKIKEMQLAKICQMSENLYRYYFPLCPLDSGKFSEKLLQDFRIHYTPVAKEFFFPTPNAASPLHFKMLCNVLEQFNVFLRTVYSTHSQKNKNRQGVVIEECRVNEDLSELIKNLLLKWQPKESSFNHFILFFTQQSFLQILELFLNADGFHFILERILFSHDGDLDDLDPQFIPLATFSTDENLTKQLGSILENLGKELIRLGESQATAKFISILLKPLIKLKKDWLAEIIQQMIHKIKFSSCSMTPLLLLHHILLDEQENDLKPTWTDWQNLQPEIKIKRKFEIEHKINQYLYQFLLKLIKKDHEKAGKIIDYEGSLKKFCQTLSQQLWQIFKDKSTFYLFLIHLLEGIKKS